MLDPENVEVELAFNVQRIDAQGTGGTLQVPT